MPIKVQTPNASITVHFEEQYEKQILKPIINVLEYVGESCIREARLNGHYIDRTGNLRSSIGYVIVNNGKILRKGMAEQTKNGKTGQKEAKNYLKQVPKEYNGLALIVVACMKYAYYVEAKGLNVLTSAELLADKLVPRMLEKLGFIKK